MLWKSETSKVLFINFEEETFCKGIRVKPYWLSILNILSVHMTFPNSLTIPPYQPSPMATMSSFSKSLQTFLIVTTGRGVAIGIQWVEARDPAKHPMTQWQPLLQQRIIWPKLSMSMLRNLTLSDLLFPWVSTWLMLLVFAEMSPSQRWLLYLKLQSLHLPSIFSAWIFSIAPITVWYSIYFIYCFFVFSMRI